MSASSQGNRFSERLAWRNIATRFTAGRHASDLFRFDQLSEGEKQLVAVKGDNFPLIPPSVRGTDEESIKLERPVILDPCKKEDCDLLAFQADGRPTLNPVYAADLIAKERVEKNKILLNIDHPDFNAKRERLYHDIAEDVKAHEALPADSQSRVDIRVRMERRLAANAPFSTAARYYLQVHRNLTWVEELLKEQ
jgi:hypothetical protein